MYGRTLPGYVLYFQGIEYHQQAEYLDRDTGVEKQWLYRRESN